jgi:hypothetical protein
MEKDKDMRLDHVCEEVSSGAAAEPPIHPPASLSTRDAVTKEIRNPLIRAEATVPAEEPSQPSQQEESYRPPSARRTPVPGLVLVPPMDISENIHAFHPDIGNLKKRGNKGLYVILTIIVAGTIVDIFVWQASGGSRTEVGERTKVSKEPNLPASRERELKFSPPRVEPLSENVREEDAPPAPAAAGKATQPAPKNEQDAVTKPLESRQKIAPLKENLSPRASVEHSPQAEKSRKKSAIRSTDVGVLEDGMDARSVARRPTTTLDETDPYSP